MTADIDAFADVIIVNYEILDRHVGWLGDFGFSGMVVDEAHFIKNKTSQRSQHVLELSEQLRARTARPLLMALTGTPLINDIEDFRAIWQFLGWIDDNKPLARLMEKLEETDLTPADHAFYPAARKAVIDMGIVRRRKVDVAADIPARRIADIPVELDDEDARSIRAAERELARRLVAALQGRAGDPSYGLRRRRHRPRARAPRGDVGARGDGQGHAAARTSSRCSAASARPRPACPPTTPPSSRATSARWSSSPSTSTSWTSPRSPSPAAASSTPRSAATRPRAPASAAIDAFVNDPDVQVIVCSLTAAGVGVNLQVASNVVLAELSWTDAEQTQAIDRVHRIGQSDPVTAWRIIAAQTIDARIAELIDSKAGLAARALDGSDEEVGSSADVQTEALVALLTDALERELG